MMRWLIGIACLLVLGVVWWMVYRLAMRDPNDGNDFSRDNIWRQGGMPRK